MATELRPEGAFRAAVYRAAASAPDFARRTHATGYFSDGAGSIPATGSTAAPAETTKEAATARPVAPAPETQVAAATAGAATADLVSSAKPSSHACRDHMKVDPSSDFSGQKRPDFAAAFYFTHNSLYGRKASGGNIEQSALNELWALPSYGLKSRFTEDLAPAGMYRRRGFDTSIDSSRVIDGAQDWMLRII